MDKRIIRNFKKAQKRLAKKIAEELNCETYAVDYEQKLPSAFKNPKTGKMKVRNRSQVIFPSIKIKKGKHRLTVIMYFSGICNSKVIGRILGKNFEVDEEADGFQVRSSFDSSTIARYRL